MDAIMVTLTTLTHRKISAILRYFVKKCVSLPPHLAYMTKEGSLQRKIVYCGI